MPEEAVQPAEAADEGQQSPVEAKEETAEAAPPAAADTTAETSADTPAEADAPQPTEAQTQAAEQPETHSSEDVSYQSVEKEGTVTAIWEMQGQKHLRTIDPRSIEGKQILALFETAG